jgi:hypothetical protein
MGSYLEVNQKEPQQDRGKGGHDGNDKKMFHGLGSGCRVARSNGYPRRLQHHGKPLTNCEPHNDSEGCYQKFSGT